jgi:hypothetical protein
MGDPEDPDLDEFFDGAPYLEEGCVDCPPPLFLLPPPPRPPHLSQEEDCPLVSSIDTCDNILILGGQVHIHTNSSIVDPELFVADTDPDGDPRNRTSDHRIRMWIREAQKNPDPADPDADSELWYIYIILQKSYTVEVTKQ